MILGRLAFAQEAVARGELHDLGGSIVKLPRVEDVERVRKRVREFATAMAMPDILQGLERLLEQREPRR